MRAFIYESIRALKNELVRALMRAFMNELIRALMRAFF